MSEKAWFESFFGEDYFEIYRDVLSPERTESETEAIASLLGLRSGARILDLACGHGRHSIGLAERGFSVTGYDLSRVFLDYAEADARARGVEVDWVKGDMRALPFDGCFDAVINVFTAFGYFDDPQDDLRSLRGIRQSLAPGGKFLLETLHRDGLVPRFLPQRAEKTSGGGIVMHEQSWDLARNVIDDQITFVRPDGTRAEYSTSVRMRSLHEFRSLLEAAGLPVTSWHGGLDGSALELNSRRLALVAELSP